ncbi:MAG: EscU/YscU/HrcU family type III secretion system export apparatus switch protein [Gemmatimonadota bacterium]|nr:EscU/YscU/HrcU family type III secretion system export apparatus switch protein [Gemmatimonadota bacterium]
MADDQERTEQATPKRREDAHRKGQVPRSRELPTALLLLAGAVITGPMAEAMGRGLVDLTGYTLANPAVFPSDVPNVAVWLRSILTEMVMLLAAPLALAVLVTGGTGALQARGVLTFEPLKPQWERLSPAKNAKRILGVQAVAELAKSVLKLGIVGLVGWRTLRGSTEDIFALAQQSPLGLLAVIREYVPRLLLSTGLVFLLLALADYGFQVWQHEKQLRMSREEIRRERKEAEGDPMVKTRMRAMARAMTRNRMIAKASEADVVVTNPTHIAVALKYDPEVAPAPIVLAMGQRKVAQRIKQIALDAGVPVVENKPLARGLFASAKVGSVIPAELYVAVAEVLAFIFHQRQRARSEQYRRSTRRPEA